MLRYNPFLFGYLTNFNRMIAFDDASASYNRFPFEDRYKRLLYLENIPRFVVRLTFTFILYLFSVPDGRVSSEVRDTTASFPHSASSNRKRRRGHSS